MSDDNSNHIQKGDQYRHENGMIETVFAVAEGRILTVHEYPSIDAFEESISNAEYVGIHSDVADLPDVDEIRDQFER